MRKFFCLILAMSSLSCSPLNNRYREEDRGKDKPASKLTEMSELKASNKKFKIEHQWVGGPFGSIHQPSSLLIFVRDETGAFAKLPEGTQLGFSALMPSMGHPLDDPGFFKELQPGMYLNSAITFNMPGDWEMKISLLENQTFKTLDEIIWLELF